MDKHLSNRVALITGGGQGIGRAVALRFAGEGAKVVVIDIVAESARAVADEIKAAGGEAMAVTCDVTRRDQIDALVGQVLDATGFVSSVQGSAFVQQPPEALMAMRFFIGVVPPIMLALAIIAVWRYPLDRESYEESRQLLVTRESDEG